MLHKCFCNFLNRYIQVLLFFHFYGQFHARLRALFVYLSSLKAVAKQHSAHFETFQHLITDSLFLFSSGALF